MCREAVARRDRLIEKLASLPPVHGALDQIVQRFGTDMVAEVTGRSRRIVRKTTPGGIDRLAVENRPGGANLAETQAFMDDVKRILVFSDAGGTGRSYHADLAARNQRLRVHYLLEPGWKAMAWAIDTARDSGSAIFTLRDSQHIGRVGTYAEQAVTAGMISLHFVNAISGAPRVAPWGGSDGRVSTEPVCIGVPTSDAAAPVVLDFATSQVALGKVRVAYKAGREMDAGVLIDALGQPTRSPAVIYEEPKGAVLPFGRYKGSGLALICGLLGGALSGGGTMQPATSRERGIVNGMFCIVIEPGRLIDLAWFRAETEAFLAHVKASAPADPAVPVLTAGEPERRHRAAAMAEGIEIDAGSWQEIAEAAAGFGITA